MKICPTCGREYHDEGQNFCLIDGAALADAAAMPTVAVNADPTSEPTVVMTGSHSVRPTVAMTPKRSKTPLIVASVIGMIVLIGISVFFLAMMMRKGEQVRANQNAVAKNTATPRVKPSPSVPLPTPVASPSEPVANPEATIEDTSEEATPITWATMASGFNQDPGRTYKFSCPEGGEPAMIWGNDVYTTVSSVCTAAVHAGVITLESGGEVTIEMRPGRSVYGSTSRNGITSNTYGEFSHSFVVR